MFTTAELQATEDAYRIHVRAGCPDDCGFCYDLLLAGAKYERELRRIADIKASRRAGSQTLVAKQKTFSKPERRKENKSKFRHR